MAHRDAADRKTYAQNHYEANKPAYVARAMAHNAKTLLLTGAWILAYLRDHPCVDCGEADPIVLDFDHRDPATKSFAISNGRRRNLSLRRIRMEVEKCDVRCANCHRRKTYADGGWTVKG